MIIRVGVMWIVAVIAAVTFFGCTGGRHATLELTIDASVQPLMAEHGVPGMAIGVIDGETTTIRCYGVACRESGEPVSPHTLFELGSISKTFTALLGASAVIDGTVELNGSAAAHYPALAGSELGKATMLQLATYTPGGLPLQVPSGVGEDTLLTYLRGWAPSFPAGSHRLYSNPSIGLFGRICASAAGRDFEEMMSSEVLSKLQLHSTFITVPDSELDRYAFGYTRNDQPVRVQPGVFAAEAYGIKTSVSDMCLYLKAQMAQDSSLSLGQAIAMTHTGHYSVGPMTQALGWEYYAYPTAVDDLLLGNSPSITAQPNPVELVHSHSGQRLYNKTGSTNGFGAYAIFVPAKRIGVVILANKFYPATDRIKAAHAILRALDRDLDGFQQSLASYHSAAVGS